MCKNTFVSIYDICMCLSWITVMSKVKKIRILHILN